MPDTAPQSQDPPKAAKTDAEILKEARERLKNRIDEAAPERVKQKDDLLFSMLEQWPSDIRNSRENDPNGPRPCLTIDQINQFIVQIINDLRQNRPSVKARPVDDKGDVKTAEVFQGTIRHIEDDSVAQIPYMTAAESAVRVGEGYFRFVTEYENETSFNQVIKIRRIPDAFAVYLGPHILPTGADAEYGFVLTDMPTSEFRRNWPNKKYQAVDFNELDGGSTANWFKGDGDDPNLVVAEYFYYEYSEPVKLLFLSDGTIIKEKDWKKDGDARSVKGERETRLRSTKWCKLTGAEILQKQNWAGKHIPIVKVTGKEAWADGKRSVWGIVRPAKDSLRNYNYWTSAITEKIALSPKNPVIMAEGQDEGHEEEWQNANRINYARLVYKPRTIDGLAVPPPQRTTPAPIEVAMVQQLQQIREDVQSSLGMFKASLGKEQPNQSGKAILALTQASDTGTYHFADNLALSIQHGGRILIDLIPKIYDTKRVMKILGEDGKVMTAEIDPEQQEAVKETREQDGAIKSIYNLGVGEYDVTASVGPSYQTKRMEAATLFTDLANSAKDPISAAVVRYLAVKNSDFSGSEVAADMLEKLLPPGLVKKDGEPEIPPEVAQKMQEMEQAGNELVQENEELKSGAAEAQAKIAAQHDAKMKELDLKAVESEREAELAKAKADRELKLKEHVAREELRIMEEAENRKADLERKKVENAHTAAMEKARHMPAGNA